MCVIFFIFGHPQYKLIVAGNRDEFFQRPTARANYWTDIGAPSVIAGIDLGRLKLEDTAKPDVHSTIVQKSVETGGAKYDKSVITEATPDVAREVSGLVQPDHDALSKPAQTEPHPNTPGSPERSHNVKEHGTWLGINIQSGAFAFVTNYREHPSLMNPSALSRGYLARDFLLADQPQPADYAQTVFESQFFYNGFNLVVGRIPSANEPQRDDEVFYCGNRGLARDEPPRRLKKGVVYGVSNGVLLETESDWPKVEHGKELLDALLKEQERDPKDSGALVQSLLDILNTKETYPESLLPKDMYDYKLENFLCPICIDPPTINERPMHYGTRTQTVILIDELGNGKFVEEDRYDSNGLPVEGDHKRREFDFVVGQPPSI
ncbi:hypothetical protein HDU85_001496 [Gaertneriomyces sp. JEL0708]|nr:hypothetical protein HDU85_001496 [Gaertneriomyces sp. JEL0708]